MNRRGFLQTCLTLAAAPAIVRADSLMRVIPRETTIILISKDWEAALQYNTALLLWPGIKEFWGKHYDASLEHRAHNLYIRAPSGGLIPGQT